MSKKSRNKFGKKGENKFGKIVISLIIAITLFIGLLVLEKNITNPNGTAKVVLAKEKILEGTVITDKNKDDLFEETTIDGKFDVDTAIRSKDELVDMIIGIEINKSELMVSSRLVNKNNLLGEIKNPVETSIRVSDVSQVVGGILREGDIIDISIINSTTNQNEEVLKNIYVTKGFSTEGKVVDRTSDVATLTLNTIMSADDESKLNNKIAVGTIRIRKVK